MKTTLDIDDALLARAKAASARERRSLTALIEEGLRLRLRKRGAARGAQEVKIPVFHGKGGLRPGIDPLSNRSILESIEGDGP